MNDHIVWVRLKVSAVSTQSAKKKITRSMMDDGMPDSRYQVYDDTEMDMIYGGQHR